VSGRIILQWIVEKYDEESVDWPSLAQNGLLVVLTHPEIWSWFSATVRLSSEKGEDFKHKGQEIPGYLVQYPEGERERERGNHTVNPK